ncbi:MAG: polysaccharide deacetylase family protein [Armatimonadetes bacterium]|nr:polysaccharide deacetylase family protein [Armatimonadota bacterium]
MHRNGWFIASVAAIIVSGGCSAPGGAKHDPASAAPQAPSDKLYEGRYLSTSEVRAKHEWEAERSIHFSKLVRGNPKTKRIALTFDDGPHPDYTPQLLDELKAAKVRATFFVIGKMVDAHPELAAREAAEGHEVANHTYNHRRLPTLTDAGIEQELTLGADAIRRAIGAPTKLYRPPGGEYDDDVINVTRRLGDCMVLWTDDPADYANPGPNVIVERTMRAVSNGGILLLHDGAKESLGILPELLAGLKARGFTFVTCSEMARERGIITTGGPDTWKAAAAPGAKR